MVTLPIALLLASLLTVLAIAVQFRSRRIISDDDSDEQRKIMDPLLGVVATLFSVLLGFMVARATDSYHDTWNNVDLEANAAANVFRIAQGLADVDRVRLRGIVRAYVNAVIDQEWNLMAEQKSSHEAWTAYENSWEAALSVQPGDDNRISNIQQALLDSIEELGVNRRLRIVASQHGLTFIQWMVISTGAAITVLITLLLPMRSISFHLFLTVLVTLSLGLNIWLLSAYSTPFAGELRIQPYMFKLLRGELLNNPDTKSRFIPEKEY